MLLCIPWAGGPADEEIEAMTHVPGSQPVYQPRGQRAGPPAVQRRPNNPVYAPRDVPPAPQPIGRPGDLFVAQNRPINPLSKQTVRVTPGPLYFERGGLRTNANRSSWPRSTILTRSSQ